MKNINDFSNRIDKQRKGNTFEFKFEKANGAVA